MLINVRGRVESDPMRVPAPAHMDTGVHDSFESMLQHAEQAPTAPPTTAAAVVEPLPTEVPVAAEDQAVEEPPEVALPTNTDIAATLPDELPNGSSPITPESITDTQRRGEPERQATAGKGTDSPRTSTRPGELLLVAVVQHGAQQGNGPLVAGSSSTVQAIGAVKGGEAATRGIDGALQQPGGLTRATPAAPGYRTSAKTSVVLLDQARDSVFKQILMKLTNGGGEMRVRLEPPDLGELDLHMLVENGNKMSLWIGAERPEVTQLLQNHLAELRQTLQAAGLEVTDAQVQTRDDRGGAGRPTHEGRGNRADGKQDDQHDNDTRSLQRRGYVTAEGLDFWV